MLLPACTGTGLAEFVIDSEAVFATRTVDDALLLPRFGSTVVALATETLSVMLVPDTTFTTKVNVAVADGNARLAMVHV
jgi:hypothetical protein